MSEAAAVKTWTLSWAPVRDELRTRCNLSEWVNQARLLRVLEGSHAFLRTVQDYYNKRRGVNLPFSPLDWLLLSELADAGFWSTAINRGIGEMFDKRDRSLQFGNREINSLAYCWQSILKMQERMKEAAIGSHEYHGDYEPHRRPHTLLLALPPGRPMFQALQSQRQVDAVAHAFQVGIVFTVTPDEYRKHQARERFGVELEFLDPDPGPSRGSRSRLAGVHLPTKHTRSRQPFLEVQHG